MAPGRRAPADKRARRVNAAVEFLDSGLSVPEAARQLARRHQISERQARRYVEQARDFGATEVPSPKIVFTVKLPEDLVRRLRSHALRHQSTLSSLVARALVEFLGRMRAGPRGGQ